MTVEEFNDKVNAMAAPLQGMRGGDATACAIALLYAVGKNAGATHQEIVAMVQGGLVMDITVLGKVSDAAPDVIQ